MILRSASVPTLSALLAEDDRCDCFSTCYACRNNRALLDNKTARQACRLPKPAFTMRRACSETDLNLFCTKVQNRKNWKSCYPESGGTLEKPLIVEERDQALVSPTDRGMPTEEHLQNTCRACSNMFSSHISTASGQGPAAFESVGALLLACQLTPPSKADYLVANSEGGLGFRDSNGSGKDGSGGPTVSSHGDADPIDLQYRQLLQLDPQNPLLLRNYAQYLSETKHDYKKSEEYYERAILACPSDGEVLSTYATHVWNIHNDAERAGNYFDQAVKAAPDDCYVLASHASFLWQSEEDKESRDATPPLLPSPNAMHPTIVSLTASA